MGGLIWIPPGGDEDDAIPDAESIPLTWARVHWAHVWLVQHAACDAGSGYISGYNSDDEAAGPCYCQWHPVAIEERSSHLTACARWPGPVCGACWAASCECGYVFADVHEAAGRGAYGRLACAACIARAASANDAPRGPAY